MSSKEQGGKYRDLHASDLVKLVDAGDLEATDELISRQQQGKSLRVYTKGRQGPYDEGECPLMISVIDGRVVVKSGRPSLPVVFDQTTALKWLFAMAGSMAYVIKEMSDNGVSSEDIEARIKQHSTEGFTCHVAPLGAESILCKFEPVGASEWSVPVEGAAGFIIKVLHAAKDLGWKLKATDDEVALLSSYLSDESLIEELIDSGQD